MAATRSAAAIAESESFLCPTLLTGRGISGRSAGSTKCERWWKSSGLLPSGSQLSVQAMLLLHGFPPDYLEPEMFVSTPKKDKKEEEKPESLSAKQYQSPKQPSPSLPQSGSGSKEGTGYSATDISLKNPGDDYSATAFSLKNPGDDYSATAFSLKNPGDDYSATAFSLKNQLPIEEQKQLSIVDYCHEHAIGQLVVSSKDGRIGTVIRAVPGNTLRLDVEWWYGNQYSRISFKQVNLLGLTIEDRLCCRLPDASKQHGTLYKFTSNRRGKDGVMRTYPLVEGDRTRDSDWYWGINIKVLVNPKKGWQSKNFGVKVSKLPLVRAAQRENKDYVYIVKEVLGKSINLC
nr:hypothetical protein [Moorena sp. SIO3I6]